MEKKRPLFNIPKPSTDTNKIALSKIWCQLNDIQYHLGKKLNEADFKKFYIQLNGLKNECASKDSEIREEISRHEKKIKLLKEALAEIKKEAEDEQTE